MRLADGSLTDSPDPAATAGTLQLEALNVSRSYPGVRALDDVSIGIGSAEIVGLVGHNGAGKSTLTRILAGAERPDRGEVRVGGQPVAFHSPHHATSYGIALVPQHLLIVPNLTVRDNFLLGSRLSRRSAAFPRRLHPEGSGAADANGPSNSLWSEVVTELGLSAYLDVKASKLSPRIQRLALIGRALLRSARVLVLDEPTAAFSQPEVDLLFSILRGLRSRRIGVLYISHRLDEILELTDRVLVLRQGKLVHAGPTRELSKHALTTLVVGRPPEKATSRVHAPSTASAGKPPLLECERLARFPKVREVSFRLRAGEILGLTGVVGAGRTSLLRVLAGAERPETGVVKIDGKPIRLLTPASAIKAGIAFIPEDRIRNAVIPNLTVAENVTLPRLPSFYVCKAVPLLSIRREQRAVNSMLARLEIQPPGCEHRKIRFLSGGNQQKAVLARWLLTEARIFFFDEPTEGIDIGTRFEIYRLIRELAENGAGVLVSSSDIEEIVAISDRVLIMHAGEITETLEGTAITETNVSHACLA